MFPLAKIANDRADIHRQLCQLVSESKSIGTRLGPTPLNIISLANKKFKS